MALVSELGQMATAYWAPLLIVIAISRFFFNRYLTGLASIPGPFLASLSDVWLLVHYFRRKGIEEFDLHKKYNSNVLRLGPNTISVADAEAVKTIYGWKPVLAKVRTEHARGRGVD